VHAANPPYTAWGRDLLPLAREAMDCAQLLGATLMLPGNVYVFGEGMAARLQEDSPQQPGTRKGRWRCAMEDELRQRATRGLRSVVVRAGDFFGSGSGSWLDLAIAKGIARGRLVYPGPLQVDHAWAYLPDLARAFVALAGRRECLNGSQSLHFAGHNLTGEALLGAIEQLADEAGQHPARGWRRAGLPWGSIRAGAWLVPMWRELAEMEYLWRVAHRLDGSRLQDLAGPLPSTPLLPALRESLCVLGLLPGGRPGGRAAAHVWPEAESAARRS
jgi:hypothetical protein